MSKTDKVGEKELPTEAQGIVLSSEEIFRVSGMLASGKKMSDAREQIIKDRVKPTELERPKSNDEKVQIEQTFEEKRLLVCNLVSSGTPLAEAKAKAKFTKEQLEKLANEAK